MRKYSPITNKHWHRTRQAVIKRSKGMCERCRKSPGVDVHHHHYNEDNTVGGEPLNWLEYVCNDCHQFYHSVRGSTAEWWRESRRFQSEQRLAHPTRKSRRRSKGSKRDWKSCRHCGGTYTEERHETTCVKYRLV